MIYKLNIQKTNIDMLGQYRIVSEILIFAIGILITGFVVVNFANIQTFVVDVATDEQYKSASNVVRTAVIRSSYFNSSLRFSLPPEISGKTYIIRAGDGSCSKGEQCSILIIDPETGRKFDQEIFNMSQSYNIIGDVVSTSKEFHIANDGNAISIKRYP